MQIHGPSADADGSEFTARFNPGNDCPFAVVEMGHVHFFITEPGECDAAIRVWVKAKQLLLGEQEPGAGTDWCPASVTDDGTGETFYCDREPGHAGSHHAPGTDEGSEVAWSDEAAQDDPEDEEDARFAAEAAELDDLEPLQQRGQHPYPDVSAAGDDCGCGLGAVRCRALEDGDVS